MQEHQDLSGNGILKTGKGSVNGISRGVRHLEATDATNGRQQGFYELVVI